MDRHQRVTCADALDAVLPVLPGCGKKPFGLPVGASGLRMVLEAWLQLRGEAPPERRISTYGSRSPALTHNLGGYPGEMVSFVSVLGTPWPGAGGRVRVEPGRGGEPRQAGRALSAVGRRRQRRPPTQA